MGVVGYRSEECTGRRCKRGEELKMMRSIIIMRGDEGIDTTRGDGVVGWIGSRARRDGAVAEVNEEGTGRRCNRGEELKMVRSSILLTVDIEVVWGIFRVW